MTTEPTAAAATAEDNSNHDAGRNPYRKLNAAPETLMLCGHGSRFLCDADEGTGYCSECERVARLEADYSDAVAALEKAEYWWVSWRSDAERIAKERDKLARQLDEAIINRDGFAYGYWAALSTESRKVVYEMAKTTPFLALLLSIVHKKPLPSVEAQPNGESTDDN